MNIREKRWQDTHDRLLREGVKAFARYGVTGTRAADVARAAGVAVGTLYFHFGDKEGLLREILDNGSQGLLQAVEGACGEDHETLEEGIRAQVEAMVEFVATTCPLSQVIFDRRLIESRSLDLEERMVAHQEATLRAWQERGLVRDDIDPVMASRARVGMLMNVLSWWCRNRRRAPRQAVVETMVRLCTSGFAGPCDCEAEA